MSYLYTYASLCIVHIITNNLYLHISTLISSLVILYQTFNWFNAVQTRYLCLLSPLFIQAIPHSACVGECAWDPRWFWVPCHSRVHTVSPNMSLLTSEVHVALTELLHGLLSSDNTQRSVAEERLTSDWLAVQPDVLLMGLVEHIQESGEASVCCP